MIPLTSEERMLHCKQTFCYICKKEFSTDDDDRITSNKKYHKVRDHCYCTGKYRGAAHGICNIRYRTPKEIPVVFCNGSTYDYHFIIKKPAKEFKDHFECLAENTEKYIAFDTSVPIDKELDNEKSIKYKIMFINSFRFMSSKLSDFIHNLSEIYSEECRGCKERKKSNQYAIL